jgi:3-phenylpropionate/cinnamic acid dioxygenase small subunit
MSVDASRETEAASVADCSLSALRDLYDQYAYLLDEGEYGAWLELFTDPCEYRVIARENWRRGLPLATIHCESREMLADRLDAVQHTQFFAPRIMRHFVSAVRQQVTEASTDAPALIASTANFLVTETLGEEPSRVYMVGQYRDGLVREGGCFRFRSKIAIYDSPMVLNSLIVPL